MIPIVDLHCDLLSFLADDPSRTILDPRSNASYPQMQQGGISLQTLAIYTSGSSDSLLKGKKQIELFKHLTTHPSSPYTLFHPTAPLQVGSNIQVLPAFENASSFCQESAPLQIAFSFLESLLQEVERILYISLTWEGENRFGGGNTTNVGLKPDGKHLLEWMEGKNIAVDLSHASDFLAADILNYLDKKSLSVPVLASHSNSRKIAPLKRNLPDEIAQEIFARKGVIGLNLFAPFIGPTPEKLADHIKHLWTLGGKEFLCLGADFFTLADYLSWIQQKYQTSTPYFPEFPNASCYQSLLSFLQNLLNLSLKEIEKLAFQNLAQYIKRLYTT